MRGREAMARGKGSPETPALAAAGLVRYHWPAVMAV
jgi:hypothetical protein